MANKGRYLRLPPELDKWVIDESAKLSKARGKPVTLQAVILELIRERYSQTVLRTEGDGHGS